jgi:beta-glucosidase-like glycosyl hydrolase
MGATWNPPLVNQVATALSDEARAIYNGWHQPLFSRSPNPSLAPHAHQP